MPWLPPPPPPLLLLVVNVAVSASGVGVDVDGVLHEGDAVYRRHQQLLSKMRHQQFSFVVVPKIDCQS